MTKVINFIAAPGVGKSIMAAKLFALMKLEGLDVELVSEYAKELVWEERHETMKDEAYLLGKQHHRLFRLNNKVDYIVTDRPLILSQFYNSKYGDSSEEFKNFALHLTRKYYNINIFLNRTRAYETKGRNQTEEESVEFSNEIRQMLDELREPYSVWDVAHDLPERILHALT